MIETIVYIVILMICCFLSFLGGRYGREVRIITIRKNDTLYEYDNKTESFIDMDDEEASVPDWRKNDKR